MKDSSYIDAQIARIPDCGDDALYRLASYLEIFEVIPDTSFSPEQRQTIENFLIGWQAIPEDESEGGEMDFPECQYIAVGLDLGSAIELGNSWRRGECLPDVGHPAADRVSNRLNQMSNRLNQTSNRLNKMQNRRDALDK